ncbi:MAG: alanine racemase [Clostridiales Family XIII bacterium]|jgi:alanine racemase|nr:alanine racemase [Clostridiales Family XIII bacterium]
MVYEARRAAWVEIDLGAITENFHSLRRLAFGCETIACVKADAYGHGLVKVSWELVKAGTEYLGVATIEEAMDLRAAGIPVPIVLFGAPPRENIKEALDQQVIPVITTYDDAQLLSEMAVRMDLPHDAEIFIAVETGMGRLGFLHTVKGLDQIREIYQMPKIKVKGIFSHFATADEPDPHFAIEQIERFGAFDKQLTMLGLDIGSRTMANSAAIMYFPQAHFEIVRPGISLYGLYPSEDVDKEILPLRPAMSVKANIVYLRNVPAGYSVSYGRRFVTQRPSTIGTIPIGYADGLSRSLTGKARVLVGGHFAPIVGTICMDQCMIDLTDVPGVYEYDEVVVMGAQSGNMILAEEIGAASGTIGYEVVCRFGQRLPHIYL